MNDNKPTKEPIFWALFGAGGTLTAFCAPAVILSLLIIPGLGISAEGLFYQFIGSVLGKLFLCAFISLSAWAGLHRVVHTLHDLKIHSPQLPVFCYGLALCITVLSLVFLFV